MKFVCDKCRTKYSIADEKVRRKVLKIRCKNCANIVVVREQAAVAEPEGEPVPHAAVESRRPTRSETGRRPLEPGVNNVFAATTRRRPAGSGSGLSRPAALAAALPDEQLEPESEETQLDARPVLEPMLHEDEWYLALDGNQFGPMAFSELCSRVKRGEARSESGEEAYVWRDGLDDWVEVTNVPELRPYFPPPPPRGGRSGLLRMADMGRQRPETMVPPVPPVPPVPSIPLSATASQPGGGRVPAVGGSQVVSAGGESQVTGRVAQPSHSQLSPIPRDPGLQQPPVDSSQTDVGQREHANVAESGLGQQPAGFTSPPVSPLLRPLESAPASRTPLSIKLAALGGIVSTLTGIAILVYVLAIDRPRHKDVAQPPLAALAGQAMEQPSPAPDRTEDQGEGSIEFPAMEIRRSKSTERAVRRDGASPAPAPVKRERGRSDEESERQRRLLALYQKNSEGREDVPAGPAAVKRTSRPRRRLGPADLSKVQRDNARALKACYERALKRDRTLSNVRIDVELSIGDTGVVRRVEVTGSNSVDLGSCLRRSLQRWLFPAVGAQTISFPLIFRQS